MAENDARPIVIKRIKKAGHGHHGGAWKVAYADFVTAMMAFFLLMWLLNATDAKKLSGLAEYFAPTVGVKDAMGIGFRGGKGQVERGTGAEMDTNKGIVYGAPKLGSVMGKPIKAEEIQSDNTDRIEITANEAQEKKTLEEAAKDIRDRVTQSSELSKYDGNMELKQTPEGLMIQILDKKGRAMFEENGAQLKQHSKEILKQVSQVINILPNLIAIEGHTSSKTSFSDGTEYTNWELSVDRANEARRFLESMGVPKEQFSKVVGRADHQPHVPSDPGAQANNRISIILLKGTIVTRHKKATPDAIFVDPKAAATDALQSVKPKDKKQKEPKAKPVQKKVPATKKKEQWSPEEYNVQNPFSKNQGVKKREEPTAEQPVTSIPEEVNDSDNSLPDMGL